MTLYLILVNMYVSELAVIGLNVFGNMLLFGLELEWVLDLKFRYNVQHWTMFEGRR